MEFETYADVIDAYNANDMGYSTLTDYIKGQNIKIKEIEMEPLADLQKSLFENKADGGSVGIEVLFGPKVPAAPSQLVEKSEIVLGYRGPGAYQGVGGYGRGSRSKSTTAKAPPSMGFGNPPPGSGGGGSGGGSGGGGGGKTTTVTSNKNPFSKKNLQTHFNNNQLLANAVKKGILTNEEYNILGGYDATQTLGLGPIDTGLSSLAYNVTQSILGNQPFSDIAGDVARSVKGATDISPELKTKYENIIGQNLADGGRVGLFMGGPALEGQALSIYDSMKAYGATDQAIADRLSSLGLYDPNASGGSTPDTPGTTPSQPLGFQGDEPDRTFVDRQDYSFKLEDYGPGKKLEIDPAAIGMSFYDAEPKQAPEGFIGKTIDAFTSVPGKRLSSFTTPTGVTPRGPAELGFMSKQIAPGIPVSRDQIRAMYDDYNQFFGRGSNYASARVPGKLDNLAKTALGKITNIPFIGAAIDKMKQGDRGLQSKYTVNNVGFGNTGGRDEFGLATFDRKDGFLGLTGNTTKNYVDRMKERLGELDDFFGSRIEGFDINNLTPDMLNQMSKINSFYTKQIQAYKQRTAVEDLNKRTRDAIEAQRIQRELEEAAKAKDKAAALAAIQKQGQADYNPNIHGPTDYGRDSQGNQSFDFGGGFGIGSDGGPVSNRTGRGRKGYSEGGVATMFTRRR